MFLVAFYLHPSGTNVYSRFIFYFLMILVHRLLEFLEKQKKESNAPNFWIVLLEIYMV